MLGPRADGLLAVSLPEQAERPGVRAELMAEDTLKEEGSC